MVWAGKKTKYCLKAPWMEQGEGFYNFKTRPDDVWVVTNTRSGTTVTQEMIWLLQNNLDYETAKKFNLFNRFPEVVASLYPKMWKGAEVVIQDQNDNKKFKLIKCDDNKTSYEFFSTLPSPRLFKTHVPLSLHGDILDSGCKIVYIARNPKDRLVSGYHFETSGDKPFFHGDITRYWNFFKNNLIPYTPYFEHVKEAWALKDHPNLLFLFFEELRADLRGTINKVADFLGKKYTEKDIDELANHLDIDNFRKNKMVNDLKGFSKVKSVFIGKGLVGGWKEQIPPEVEAEIDEWIAENLKDSDLTFSVI
ncbi:sulfotransferase 1C4-like [Aphidius gifuensis]|uniref:sulfotransferase 1C4-like n=1 Tax=Aphidius gifuensis TaxID=684658 RepID=UPI001CDD49D8|nr:sulfotransferase 1C4-like [Aphidius gifuensis]